MNNSVLNWLCEMLEFLFVKGCFFLFIRLLFIPYTLFVGVAFVVCMVCSVASMNMYRIEVCITRETD